MHTFSTSKVKSTLSNMAQTSTAAAAKRKPSYIHPEVFSSSWNWRTVFVISIILKTYFSLSTSYIHPDEHFQGPEALADHVFGWATKRSWEFTSDAPVRSYFVSWIVYGLPMTFIEMMFASKRTIEPIVVLYSLRLTFTLGSWILSDMAIDRLTTSKQHKLAALFIYGTSYVSWIYQSHTFSNSVETVILLWCLVIIHEFQSKRQSWISRNADAAMLGSLIAFGIFNRVTFPAFLLIPGLRLLPWLVRHPISLIIMAGAFACTSVVAIYVDTICFSIAQNPSVNVADTINQFIDEAQILRATPTKFKLVVAPLNNLLYNLNSSNLALHGIHSRLQHILVNLPTLLGPALILLFSTQYLYSLPLQSAVSGLLVLSSVQHQEPRFLLPVVPLLCCCLDFTILRGYRRFYQIFFSIWCFFNIFMGALMGIMHQGGIVSAQAFISHLSDRSLNTTTTLHTEALHNSTTFANATETNVFLWWKTYSPPIWLLGQPLGSVETIDAVETIGGGGDNVYRYQPMFSYLADFEHSLNSSIDYSYLKGPSTVLNLEQKVEASTTLTTSTFSTTNTESIEITNNSPVHTFEPIPKSPHMVVMDLMGASPPILHEIMSRLAAYTSPAGNINTHTYLVAPISVFKMNKNLGGRNTSTESIYSLEQIWEKKSHLSLDDIDLSNLDSLTPGLGIWEFKAST